MMREPMDKEPLLATARDVEAVAPAFPPGFSIFRVSHRHFGRTMTIRLESAKSMST
jgi:creatinine amidohydrolase/Fe(II)-dependent formamide hydrolase-like protein